jgi:small subunit ribosomal protein S2
MQIPSEQELFKAGVHFGHKLNAWHPKMKPYIYGQKNGVYIIDLAQTRKKLAEAIDFIKETVAGGKQILFVGTKIQAQKIIQKYVPEVAMPFVDKRWLGGTLTNFQTIHGLVRKYKNFEKMAQDPDYEKKYTKKERLDFSNEAADLKESIGGIIPMEKLPGAIFVSSARYDKIALAEARKKGIPSIAICDVNANPDEVDYPIPANDDAVKSIELIVSLLTNAIKENQEKIISN